MQKIEGALDLAALPALLGQRKRFAAAGVLDLSGVVRSDSASLAFLLELIRLAHKDGRALQFINMPAQLAALAQFFQIEDALNKGNPA